MSRVSGKSKINCMECQKLLQKVSLLENALASKKKIEEEQLKNKNLESMGILAGGIAHDFNNLLAIILGNISLIKLSPFIDTKIKSYIERAENAIADAKDLTSQLLTFSQGGSPIFKTVPIPKIIKNITGHTISGSNVRCEYNLGDDLWSAHIDENQISVAIRHIITNAMEAMPHGGLITITGDNLEISDPDLTPFPPNKYVKITIQDNGVGIPEENIEHIYSPFFTTKSLGKEKGKGLGIPITYSIVKKHGGHIEIRSLVNIGTWVEIYLPAAEAAPQEKYEREVSESRPVNLKPRKILVMDDENFIREMFVQMGEEFGYRCDTAANGEEVIHYFREAMESREFYDIVILDLTVKEGMGGKKAIEILRQMDPDITAIVSSGFLFDEVMENYKNFGFKAVLPKPFTIDELKNILDGRYR